MRNNKLERQQEQQMLKTKDAIEMRRSIRKFKSDDVSDEIIFELLESARLAPSGCNSQPWRFKIVRDQAIRDKLSSAAHNQVFIKKAPVVIVCCLDVKGYFDGTVSSLQDMEEGSVIDKQVYDILINGVNEARKAQVSEIIPRISFNVAIAVEHIVLRALDFGLGTCWIRLLDSEKVKQIFDWDENTGVVALLPLGYPDENPKPRKRVKIEEILL